MAHTHAGRDHTGHSHGADSHDGHSHEGHSHGVVDPSIATSERGLWAAKWPGIVLAAIAIALFANAVLAGYESRYRLFHPEPVHYLGLVAAMAIFTRVLDGVEPETLVRLDAMARDVDGVRDVFGVRARWVGHRLHAEANVVVTRPRPATTEHRQPLA